MLKVGSRASTLATAQAEQVVRLITDAGVACELVLFETKGDKILDRALDAIGDKGLFTTELENALIAGTIDLAVHSLKDLPTTLMEDLTIGAYLLPEDPRDVLIAAPHLTWETLPSGAVIGTSSLRRKAFLSAMRPDLEIVPVRGNLQTRVEKWKSQGWDGLILAAAGVHRLHWQDMIASYMDPWTFVPSPGQGVLAAEIRRDNEPIQQLLASLNDEQAALRARAVRACLAQLGGGCQIPFGAYAELVDSHVLRMRAKVGDLQGEHILVADVQGNVADPERIGREAGQRLIEQGALKLL
ncbi:hydroxymethylbilane synthase [Sulfobacillus thermotolerans]|uniref:Porphobilinogen deaminase n=1 Tax=Sulfobacillus thermotolerans TaxID=338644 RepID=A0ABM6RSF4_9FIRM|nr:hydroxymethylbilane synthase [Sulfobacillus thermotolerans]